MSNKSLAQIISEWPSELMAQTNGTGSRSLDRSKLSGSSARGVGDSRWRAARNDQSARTGGEGRRSGRNSGRYRRSGRRSNSQDLSEQVDQTDSTETTFGDDAVRRHAVRRGTVRVQVVGRSEWPERSERHDAIAEHVRIVELFWGRWSGHRRPKRSGVDLFGIESCLLQSRHLSGLNTATTVHV